MDHNPDCTESECKDLCVGGCCEYAVREDPREDPEDHLSKYPWSCNYYSGGWKNKEPLFRRPGPVTGENDKKQADSASDNDA